MLRALDIIFSLMGLVLGFPVLLVIYLLGLFDTGAPLFRQERVGRYQKPFTLVKFRTMRVGTASVASHLADVNAITPMGQFLRRTKLDELPQLWNVLWGDMSLVGPRPGLFNQKELLQAREQHGVFAARPGITGLAQVKYPYGASIEDAAWKHRYDVYYIKHQSLLLDIKILLLTVKVVLFGMGR